MNKMKIEIWSDVMCPFCYLGKRKFEQALLQFAHKEEVEVDWKSFQLMPALKTNPEISIHDFLAEEKGFHPDQAKKMNEQVKQMGNQAGLDYRFDDVVVANTFKAHRLIQFAKNQGKQQEAEEILFRAFFTDGKNVDDNDTLVELGKEIGLDTDRLSAVLQGNEYSREVVADIEEASQLGIHGVPYFVLDRKYGVSGAQESGAFLAALEKAYSEWKKNNPHQLAEVLNGQTCTPDGNCD